MTRTRTTIHAESKRHATNDHTTGHLRHAYIPSGFFMLRTPLMPFDTFSGWMNQAVHDGDPSDIGYERLRAQLRLQLRSYIDMPIVREALYLASPTLYADLPIWLQQPDSDRGRSIERPLVRYFARMTGRATPFGLFAGWTTGRLGDDTDLRVGGSTDIRRHTRLDAGYLSDLCDAAANDPIMRRQSRYGTNSSLYDAAGKLRYAEAVQDRTGRRYRLVQLEPTEYLVDLLEYARGGVPYSVLMAYIRGLIPDMSREEAIDCLDELIGSQLLVSELSPTVAGEDLLEDLIGQCSKMKPAPSWGERLIEVRDALKRIDDQAAGHQPEAYERIKSQLSRLPVHPLPSHLFQVDMSRPSPAPILGDDLVDTICTGIEALRYLIRPAPATALDTFRKRFTDRYGDREVPLAEALDDELGVGFGPLSEAERDPSPLLEGLATDTHAEEEHRDWTDLDGLLLRKLTEYVASDDGSRPLELDQADLERLRVRPAELADAYAAMVTVSGADSSCPNGDVLLHAVMGPSGARMLGRFCHADPVLEQGVLAHLRHEESLRPDAIFAEIVHLPEGRMGNIMARPRLREYEIQYLCRSTADADRRIPLSDLLVSVRGGRIRLRSRRLDREIIPRMSNALTYQGRGLAVYRFLGELQGQDVTGGLRFEWGPFAKLPYLPRVVYGRVVLARARWNIAGTEIEALAQADGEARFRAAQAWRARLRLPRFAVLTEFDQELPIDFDNPLSVDAFVHYAKSRDSVMLMEQFPEPDALPVEGPDGRYMNELIVPFAKRLPASAPLPAPMRSEQEPLGPSAGTVSYAPGSEWLYAKLYASPAEQDRLIVLLRDIVIEPALERGSVDRWFFIRYGDPELHLRLRLHGDQKALMQHVLPLLHAQVQPWIRDGRIARMQLDTYEPEMFRYGGRVGLPLAEQLFHADSDAVARIVAAYGGSDGWTARWKLALAGIDLLLGSLGLDEAGKRSLIAEYRDAYRAEFRAGAAFRKSVSRRLREERGELLPLIRGELPAGHPLAPGLAILQERSRRLETVAEALAKLDADPSSGVSIRSLAPSFIHMHVNRLIRSSQREHEHVLYDMLALLYDTIRHKEAYPCP